MVFPQNTQDVSEIVKVLTQNSCPFGMRSGAHSAFEGANGIKDGVTVDFGRTSASGMDPNMPNIAQSRTYERDDV